MAKKKLIFIKLGGSLITDKNKPYYAKTKTIRRLASSLAKVRLASKDSLFIIGNGAGSYGHYAASTHDHTMPFGFSFVQQKVKELNSILIDSLLENKIAAVSFPFSAISTAVDGNVDSVYLDSFAGSLRAGIVPVVYGDVVFDTKTRSSIFSTEKIFSILIEKLGGQFKIDRVIHLTVVNGFLDEKNDVVPHINNQNYGLIKKHLFKTSGYDVTGGMHHKIVESLILAKKGIITNIANGEIDGVLEKILLKKEEIGTTVTS